MAAEALPARHDLVWLAAGWRGALVEAPADPARAAVEEWIARGRPAVACRSERASRGVVALGVALPAGAPVRRAALLVRRGAVERTAPPLALAVALPAAPAAWRAPLARLDAAFRSAGMTLRAYGSLAWQHLSGIPYLTQASDVDLLVRPRDAAELRSALTLLAAGGTAGGPRLDGEIQLPDGRGVAWRELASRPERVLVKSARGVALERTGDWLGPLAGGLQ